MHKALDLSVRLETFVELLVSNHCSSALEVEAGCAEESGVEDSDGFSSDEVAMGCVVEGSERRAPSSVGGVSVPERVLLLMDA